MHCQKCGKQLPESSEFCAYCGERQHLRITSAQTSIRNGSSKAKKKRRILLWVAGGVVVMTLLIVLETLDQPKSHNSDNSVDSYIRRKEQSDDRIRDIINGIG